MALAFAGALLVSGVSSSGVGTLAGQTVMAGFLDLRIPLFIRRGVTMVPALVVLAVGINATDVLNFDQVALSFGISFALVPLIMITRTATVTGAFVNPRWLTAVISVIAVAVVVMNTSLSYQQFLGDASARPHRLPGPGASCRPARPHRAGTARPLAVLSAVPLRRARPAPVSASSAGRTARSGTTAATRRWPRRWRR